MIDLYKSGATAEQVAQPLASANAASNGYSSNTAYAAGMQGQRRAIKGVLAVTTGVSTCWAAWQPSRSDR